jgi:hypothetical protein
MANSAYDVTRSSGVDVHGARSCADIVDGEGVTGIRMTIPVAPRQANTETERNDSGVRQRDQDDSEVTRRWRFWVASEHHLTSSPLHRAPDAGSGVFQREPLSDRSRAEGAQPR